MLRAGLAGVRPDAAAAVFPPSMKINHAAPIVKALAPPKRLYNFTMPALCCQLAPNQRAAGGPTPGLRNRCKIAGATRQPFSRFGTLHAVPLEKAQWEVRLPFWGTDRKSTRLNSSHLGIS